MKSEMVKYFSLKMQGTKTKEKIMMVTCNRPLAWKVSDIEKLWVNTLCTKLLSYSKGIFNSPIFFWGEDK